MSDEDHRSPDRLVACRSVCRTRSVQDGLGTDLIIESVSFAVDALAW